MTPWAPFLGLATNILQGSADLADTGRVRYLLLTFTAFLGACMSTENVPVMTTLISQPAGATCTAEDGEVYTLPAVVPCHPEGATRFEVSLPGHAPRTVHVLAGTERPNLSCLLMADMVRGLVVGTTDGGAVDVVEGAATIELEPLAPRVIEAGFELAPPTQAEIFDVRANDGSSIGSLPSPLRFW